MKSIDLFEVLVRENAGMLSAFIRSTAPTNARDDIWQDTMLTAWRRWDDYDRTRPFGAWLRGIAIKNIQTWHRKNKREQPHFDQATLNYMSDEFGRIHHLHGDTFDEKLSALRTCIDSLPDMYRETVKLRYEQELLPSELATRLAKNSETVKKQLQRAKSMLLDCINRKMANTTPQHQA